MNIGRILLTKKSLLTGRTYSYLSKKMKKKTKKESERRKLIRKRSLKEKNMVQKLYDTCKEVFANGKAGYVPPPSDIHRLKLVLGEQQSGIRLAKVHFDADITAPCDASVLFPESGGNLHCFKALTPCILLDVLGPPYSESEGRHCTYYQDFTYDCFSDVKEVKVEEDGTRYAWLKEKNEQFVVLGGTYEGPTIQI
ncbi:plant cysteine oxidase 2-like isoform X2 [Nicotiana tabacum]|uniref:Plant cysteine oxidase 2-like isoform X2 n=1 Tax=Nicotiana tabacum TaxID=4097 RepID=A0AC58URH1_TOBAC